MSSGGMIYHLRALRYNSDSAEALWAGHREGVRRFLERWNPKEKNLVIVGSSAGYSLPTKFLKSFHKLTAIEPDGLARILFEKRHGAKPTWIKQKLNFEEIPNFLQTLPDDTAILFSNLLGQVPLRSVKKNRSKLMEALNNFSWASFHDVLSGENVEFDCELIPENRRAKLSDLKASVYPKIRSGTLALNAHEAMELFECDENLTHTYWQWRILPRRSHLIEGVYHVKT